MTNLNSISLTHKFKSISESFEDEINLSIARGFNGSVNISESCDFRSQFDPLYIIF